MTDKVQVEIKGDVATITLNKPERLNALDNEMWHGIGEACRAVDAAPDVRVAILMGAGGCFCAGLDVKAGSTLSGALDGMSPGQAIAHIRRHLEGHQASFAAVESLRVPVIGTIQRACMGAGLELALCCDVRLAAEGTLFSIPEVQLGLVPDMGGTQRLPRTVGIGKAKELIYSARRIDAAEALRIGLVNSVCPPGELAARAAELAAEIAANAPLAVQAAKELALRSTNQGLAAGLRFEQLVQTVLQRSEDAAEGRLAFAEKRPPKFTGN
jgi:enoyl-CoA hydratase/carnithine racemase